MNAVIALAQDLTKSSIENANAINKLQRGVESNKEYIERVDQRANDLKTQVESINKKITEISDLRDQLKVIICMYIIIV